VHPEFQTLVWPNGTDFAPEFLHDNLRASAGRQKGLDGRRGEYLTEQPIPLRTSRRWILDFVTFPLRAVTLFDRDRFGLSSLRSERFDYCASEVRGYCLDVGCGRHNTFVSTHLGGRGIGIDVYPYEGLSPDQIFPDLTVFPFKDGTFETVTFIANLNHVPRSLRARELAEAFRCLRPGGRIIVTMGAAVAEVMVHHVVRLYDRVLGTAYDVDGERGMGEEEAYFLKEAEIRSLLAGAGFAPVLKRRFLSQWGLNSLYIGLKA
jgi:SAM-dependent methyltransferase